MINESAAPVQYDNSNDVSETVNAIVESLTSDITGYQQACQMYGSEFFEDETPEFKKQLCVALIAKFAEFTTNNYWRQLVGD